MKIKLHDQLDYLIHVTELEKPIHRILVWGNRIFLKIEKQHYRQISYTIITDTEDSDIFKCLRD